LWSKVSFNECEKAKGSDVRYVEIRKRLRET
jgi:hypothetical protein